MASRIFDWGHQEELEETAGACKPHKQLVIFKFKIKICLSMAVGVEMTALYVQMVMVGGVLES